MRGRDFLDTAQRLSGGKTEADYRSAISRSYYGLFIECRDALLRWGFVFPSRNSHREVQQRLTFPTNVDLNQLGDVLSYLVSRRNCSDYDMINPRPPQTGATAADAVVRSRNAVALLDAIDADPTRRAQAIADIRAAFP
jgi:uncharacterized protein (UPF0332 family)